MSPADLLTTQLSLYRVPPNTWLRHSAFAFIIAVCLSQSSWAQKFNCDPFFQPQTPPAPKLTGFSLPYFVTSGFQIAATVKLDSDIPFGCILDLGLVNSDPTILLTPSASVLPMDFVFDVFWWPTKSVGREVLVAVTVTDTYGNQITQNVRIAPPPPPPPPTPTPTPPPAFPAGQPWLQHGSSTPNMIHYVDVNGDGKADALYFDTSRSNGLWVALSNGSGFVSVGMKIQYGVSAPEMIQFADVTGDGLPDALYFDTNNSNQVIVSRNLGNDSAGNWLGFGPQERWLQHGPSTPDMIQYADVNGDGKADALYFDTSRSKCLWLSLSTGTGFTTPRSVLCHGGNPVPKNMQFADVNGDGKADALYFAAGENNTIWVSLSTGDGFTQPQPWLQHGSSTPDMIHYADVNGDGKADALYFDTSRSNGVWVSLSTGTSFTTPQMWLQHGPSTPTMIQYKDVNGDGKADALYFDTSRSRQVWLSLSTGSGFAAPTPFMQEGDSTPDMIQYADVNGDGKADALYFDTSRSRQVWVLLAK